jgi:hypothetical protein
MPQVFHGTTVRRLLGILTACAWCFMLPFTSSAQIDIAHYTALRAAGSITVDGKLDEPAWSNAAEGILTETNTGNPVPLRSTVKVLWDDTYMYVGFSFEDPDAWATITAEDGPIWDEEAAEVFIDPEGLGHSYYEFEINPINQKVDLFVLNQGPAHNGLYKIWIPWDYTPSMKKAVFVNGDGKNEGTSDTSWSVELAFPFADLWTATNIPPMPGETWRIGFYRIERGSSATTADDWYAALSPTLNPSFHTPWRFAAVTFSGSTTAVQDPAPPEFRIGSVNYPNPFNPATTIEFTVPRAGNVTLTVYNTAGQKVRELLADTLSPGTYRILWDGCDSGGRTVSSGTYLYRVGMKGYTSGGKMEIIR